MADEENPRSALDYQTASAPRPRASLLQVAWGASGCGAMLFGIVLPCGGMWYASAYLDDMGGPLFWPFAFVAGCIVGALIGPLVSIPTQLLLRHFRCRP